MRDAFKFHKLNETGQHNANVIEFEFDKLADALDRRCPASREKSLAMTKLEEACFFAKKAMANAPHNQQEEGA